MSVVGSVQYVGGPGGQYIDFHAWKSGKVVTKLTVFTESERVRGAYVWMTGQGQYEGLTIGKNAGTASTFEFQSGEFITSMSLWNGRWENNDHLRAGHIRFSTNKGRSFDAGPGQIGSEYKIDVQSGILVGVQAYAGEDINKWAFVFLKPVLLFSLRDVKYPGLIDTGGIVPVTLDRLSESNDGPSSTLNWKLNNIKDQVVSWNFSETEGITQTFGFQVSAGIPEIGLGVSENFEWQVSESLTRSQSYSETRTLEWDVSGSLSIGESVKASALTQIGTVTVPYTGNMMIKTQDGSTYSYPWSGTYDGIAVTKVEVEVQ